MENTIFILKHENIYIEVHCDECGEPCHTHIDCPVCNKEFSETNCFGDIYDEKDNFKCINCNTEFKIISKDDDLNMTIKKL